MVDELVIDQVRDAIREAMVDINRQRTVYVQDLKHPELELKRPLPVFLETDGSTTVANYFDTESFGNGDNEYEALNDLCTELAQTYLDLEADQEHLGPLPALWWAHLQTIIERKTGEREEA